MRAARGRARRGFAAAVTGLLLSAGLTAAEIAPASAVVPDQPVSAVASSMWQTNNTVWALDVKNGVVYAGGDFTSVRPPGAALGTGEVTRNHLAAFNASTGALITSFNPNVNGRVLDVAVSPDGSKLYVAGSFTTVGGATRQRIARLNLPSGSVDSGWSANADGSVATVAVNSSAVYVGGDFTTIKNVNRTRLARLSTQNGDVSATFTASSDKRITESAIAPDGSRVLVGGENDVVNGQPQAGIASLDPTTGALRPWAATGVSPRLANGGCDANLTDIVVSGTVAYVTAEAPRPGCWEGVYAANISDGSLIFNRWCLGGSTSLAVAHGWIYRGSHNHDCTKNAGGFTGPNDSTAFVWYRLEAIGTSDGELGHWTPNTNGGSAGTSTTVGPQVMATDGSSIFVGGDQSQVNGSNQEGLTRFTTSGGNSAPQTPVAPTGTASAAGHLTIVANGVADDNNGVLTYRLYRDGGNTPIATRTAESWPWSRPVLRFEDSGLAASSSHTYQIQANDGTTSGSRSPASLAVTVRATSPATYQKQMLATSPASYWRLHTLGPLMADTSPNKSRGRVVGGVTRRQPGALAGNRGIVTDGSTGYVRSNVAFKPTAAFSESVWFKTTSNHGGSIMGFSNAATGAGTANNRAIWMDNDGKVAFGILTQRVGRDPRPSFVRSAVTYNDGNWHHVTGTFDGTSISLYLDGVLVGTYARPATDELVPVGSGYTRVGYQDLTSFYTVFGSNFDGRPALLSYFFDGSLDEAATHSTALSAAQVASLWAAGAASPSA